MRFLTAIVFAMITPDSQSSPQFAAGLQTLVKMEAEGRWKLAILLWTHLVNTKRTFYVKATFMKRRFSGEFDCLIEKRKECDQEYHFKYFR